LSHLALAQAPLQEVADRIQRLVEEQNLDGFAGVALDGARTISVYWKGSIPNGVAELIADLPPGLDFQVHDVPYTESELLAEAQRIAELDSAAVGVQITRVGTLSDFSGLEVGIDSSVSASVTESAVDAINSPMKLVLVSDATEAVPAARYNDISPFWGGGLIADIDNFFDCSAGVAAKTASGAERMITADHCGDPGSVWWNGTHDRIVGTMQPEVGESASHDAGMLGGQDYDPVIYFGNWDSTTGFAVRDRANPALGAVVWSGGAYDGSHALTVTAVNQFVPVGGLGLIGPGFWTNDNNGLGTVGEGDSGGPVTTILSGGTTLAVRGIHIAIDRNFLDDCVGLFVPGRECSTRSFHGNITQTADVLNVSIQIAPK
jgi:hypothetical protein